MHEHAAWRAHQVSQQASTDNDQKFLDELAVEYGLTKRQVIAALSGCRVTEIPKDIKAYDPDKCMLVDFDFMEE